MKGEKEHVEQEREGFSARGIALRRIKMNQRKEDIEMPSKCLDS